MLNWKQVYEEALRTFETGNIEQVRQAGYRLSEWRKHNEWDQPSLVLMGRIVNAVIAGALGDKPRAVPFTKE